MHLLTLKLAVRGPSPMVWRRLRIVDTTSIADLHHIFQISMGWDDENLHCFRIHGKDYGISYAGGTLYDDDAEAVKLADFGFDVGDKFTYTYNFIDQWLCDVRVEAVDPILTDSSVVPICLGGKRRHGVSDYDVFVARENVIAVVATLLDGSATVGTVRRALEDYDATRFNRQAINQLLSKTPIHSA